VEYPAITADDLAGDPRRIVRERLVRAAFFAAGIFSILISVAIVVSLVREAIVFLEEADLSTIWSRSWNPRGGSFDMKTLLVATIGTSFIAMVVAMPIGLGSAIYLSEYAPQKVRKVLKPVIEVLAGIPSVVLGFFALTWIAPNIVDRFFDPTSSQNLLTAGIGVGILTIPLVASISEDALTSVPMALREASYGVGAKKVQTVIRIVIPASVSGLVAAFIIAISRAIGETLVVTIAAGASGQALFPDSFPAPDYLLEPGLTMTAAMATLAAGSDQVVGQGPSFQSLFFVGLLLFVITLALNIVASRIVRRLRQTY
jgi:phosphate transport system permease protein